MDKNIDLKNLINSITKISENNSFFKDMIGLNESFVTNQDMEECIENRRPCLNTTTTSERQEVNETNFSFNLLSEQEMDTKLTPSLDVKIDVNQRNHLFAFHNKRQLFGNNFCDNHQKFEPIERPILSDQKNELKDNEWENTLGLSPVKNNIIKDDISSSISISDFQNNGSNNFEDFNGLQVNGFSSNSQQLGMESLLNGESFKSLSKCSDLDLRAEEQKVDINQTFRTPNSNFENKSICSYFKQHSEPISSIKTMDISVETISTSGSGFSVMDESFASVFNEIDSANNTLEIAQKLIDRKQRKRKSDATVSVHSSQDIRSETDFSPDLNSTLNSSEDISDNNKDNNTEPIKYKSVSTSGLGTMTTLGQTYSMPTSNRDSNCVMNANCLTLNQLLIISPNVLSLTMGCFIDFKLNYLKVRNLSITSFKAEIKLQTDADTLNAFDIQFPKQSINIPAFFDGLLSDQIIITPLKSGSFTITFQIYTCIEGINLPISPMSVICQIRSEEIVIKRPLYSSDSTELCYHLFEDNCCEPQTIELCVSNRQIMNEIPLKMCLEPNKHFVFEPTHRHPNSIIHTFRCSDPNTLFLVTKTQYEMQIPIRIQSFGVHKTDSRLTVSTDSLKGHVLALFHLRATFWPRRQLKESLLQCSDTSITLKAKTWKAIHFRNKSKESLIRTNIRSSDDSIKLSTNRLMIPPLHKTSIGLMVDRNNTSNDKNSNLSLIAEYNSGFGKSLTITIPITTVGF